MSLETVKENTKNLIEQGTNTQWQKKKYTNGFYSFKNRSDLKYKSLQWDAVFTCASVWDTGV